MMSYYLIAGLVFLASFVIQQTLKSKFKKYSQIPLQNGMSGAEIAERMLAEHGISGVRVACVSGELTDHYHPTERMVNLSEAVYYGRNAAAAAVAAHECGHAVQHARAYSFLSFRSAMVPILNVSNTFLPFILMAGVALLYFSGIKLVLLIGVVLFSLTTLFSFITLPVEFDASARALRWMESRRIVNSQEYGMAKSALFWAALTYVVAALGSLATLLYYVFMLFGRRD
jgi:Zn-dependent membrane protease YugP